MRPIGIDGERDLPLVRRADERDWAHVKAVRLAALTESPAAFGSSLAREQGFEDEDWRKWTRGAATFLAFQNGAVIGLAAGVDGDRAYERSLVAAWVHPDHRRRGVASELVAAVKGWARDDEGATRLTLWVTRTNEAAARLYRRHGFKESGKSKPLPSNKELVEDQFALELS